MSAQFPETSLDAQATPALTAGGVIGAALRAGAIVVVLVGCGECLLLLRAERVLVGAAQAAVEEAMLPKASPASISAVVSRQLRRNRWHPQVEVLPLVVNGELAHRPGLPREGDRFTVSLAVPHSAVVPEWCPRLDWFGTPRRLRVSATRVAESHVPR